MERGPSGSVSVSVSTKQRFFDPDTDTDPDPEDPITLIFGIADNTVRPGREDER